MKRAYKSKTVWAAVLIAVVTIWNAVAEVNGWPVLPKDDVLALLAALGLYGLRTAKTTIGAPE